jgi:hypothetical protein
MRRRVGRVIVLGGCLAACLMAGGCSAAGAVAYKFMGPPAVEPQYTPKNEPLLVFVENYRVPAESFVTADQLGREIADDLRAHQVAPIVEFSALERLKQQQPDGFGTMHIRQIGKAVGAAQVLYVELVHVQVAPEAMSDYYRGTIAVRVKLVSVQTGRTLWPDTAESFPLSARTPSVRDEDGATPESARQCAVHSIAIQVARLFYKWTPEG